MDKLQWCAKQGKGIRLIEPNEIIAQDYLRKADGSLQMMSSTTSQEWKAVGAYYAAYEVLYALLQKAGIKCEIHDCSLALMKFFDFTTEEIDFVQFLKEQRINAQYYVNRQYRIADEDKVKSFVLNCKQKMQKLNFKEIKEKIRGAIS